MLGSSKPALGFASQLVSFVIALSFHRHSSHLPVASESLLHVMGPGVLAC
jgi:hypothetical protein